MDLDPQYTDKMGDPLLRFTLDWTEHEHRQRVYAAEIQMKIAKAMGVKFDETRPVNSKYNVVQYQTTHIQGGAVMGTAPENSVVNTNLQHWNVAKSLGDRRFGLSPNCLRQPDPDRARTDVQGGGCIHCATRGALQGGCMIRREFLTVLAEERESRVVIVLRG